ncbi:hypothetical protein PYW07_004565 [Mythimna separata]|uniref:UDP-glucuronosyltransferase n=1 Tax=Mythimna separata TaxID=271217 RepID=A0AAD7YXX6_MYTSE|nr:hypothetical protein PYW07_004565 [Mythimna separata]
MDTFTIVLLFLAVAKYVEPANILYVVPFTSKSHFIMLKPIGLELARRGHNVTVITGNRVPDPPKNYHQYMVDEKEIWDIIGGGRPNVFDMVDLPAEKFHHNILWKGGIAFTELVLNSTEIKTLLKEDTKFDLVISEQFFQEALNILAHKYNAPLVLVTTFGNCMRHNMVQRNPLQLATVVSEFLDVREPTSFLGRMRNLYFTLYEFIYWKNWYLDAHEKLVKKYLPDLPKPVPKLYDVQKNASLILINGHFSFDTSAAYLPNVVEIGGVHLSESDTKLPEDLQKILDNAKHGAVYMNFGSNVRSSELPAEKRNAFLNVFRKLKQTILWKWEDDKLENKPNNLIVRKWLPQKEILSHPNIRVFISHGGLIGTQEATFHGVPIVGIPIYADQYNNLLQAQSLGYGKILKYPHINEQTLSKTLNEVLTNNSYRIKAKELSARFKDRPMSALDTAMFWIEYVIRNNGAEYMKNPAMKLNWFAYTMLDVYAFILVLLFTLGYVISKIFTIITNLCTMEPVKKQKKKFM